MGQEFFIKSDNLESQVRKLLPSQGGLGQGFDLSASTQIVPIIDLTETAEGSGLRSDLQTALSHSTANEFNIINTTTTIINNTGYYRVAGTAVMITAAGRSFIFKINDGATDKILFKFETLNNSDPEITSYSYDFNVFLSAGDSLIGVSNNLSVVGTGSARQIADIDGNLVNP